MSIAVYQRFHPKLLLVGEGEDGRPQKPTNPSTQAAGARAMPTLGHYFWATLQTAVATLLALIPAHASRLTPQPRDAASRCISYTMAHPLGKVPWQDRTPPLADVAVPYTRTDNRGWVDQRAQRPEPGEPLHPSTSRTGTIRCGGARGLGWRIRDPHCCQQRLGLPCRA